MAKKRKRLSPAERAEWKLRSERTERVLLERIAYYDAKLAEQKRAGD